MWLEDITKHRKSSVTIFAIPTAEIFLVFRINYSSYVIVTAFTSYKMFRYFLFQPVTVLPNSYNSTA